MEVLKIAKVEGVQCRRTGETVTGILHLTAHHLIFECEGGAEEEMWVPYPLISLVTRLPLTLEGYSPLAIHLRNFRSFTLLFKRDTETLDVFDSVKGLTVISSVSQLYAFFYSPSPPLSNGNGWVLYSQREEFARMGVGSRTKAWRFTDINKDYSFCPTYPARLVVPTRISDATLQHASKYRSKSRIPTLTYLHWANYGTITRSSQPMVGLTNNRSIQDEKLIEAVFQSHHFPEARTSAGLVYGATSTNLIIDARPTTNAMANVAKGAGTENMDYYREGKKAYLGIDNIHVMRDSLNKVVETLRGADALAYSIGGDGCDRERLVMLSLSLLDRQTLRRSGWLRHLSAILDGTLLIVRNVHVNSSHVLIHCSDGWDRTAQLSSLAQLCLDPFYRTFRGFQILIEKDWLSFGHRFLDRCGHLSSEKVFLYAADVSSGGGAEAAQALFASVQNRLVGQGRLKEMSPVFHQFLECVRQVQRQFPERFEFNSRYLEQIHYHVYSCQFGTFLFNCERDRRMETKDNIPPPYERTVSLWDFLNSTAEIAKNLNPSYDSALDNPIRRDSKANMGVLFPDPKDVRFWNELYGRSDEEMNGRLVPTEAQGVDVVGPVEGTEDDPMLLAASAKTSNVHKILAPFPLSSPSSRSQSPVATSSALVTVLGNPTSIDAQREDMQELTSSLSTPEPTQQMLGSNEQDSSKPLIATTLLTGVPPGNEFLKGPSSETISARSRIGAKHAEVFPESMKSMWGKFSSNASAAFTAVQGAYDGVSKELKGMTLTQSWDNGRAQAGELRAGERPFTPNDEIDRKVTLSAQARDFTLPHSWANDDRFHSSHLWTEGPQPSLSALPLDNPWRNQSHTSGHFSNQPEIMFHTPSVWADNTIRTPNPPKSDPAAIARSSTSAATFRVPPEKESLSSIVRSRGPSINSDSDPLGVL
ncbi:hypothetical protein M0805_003839 [Coniferiporia weirii]|nr:hypothetical protein M0805_003839 [Coniferiporia weirii]